MNGVQTQNSQVKIVAVVGRLAAGKDEMVRYLQRQYGVPTLNVGAIARELAEQEGEESPENYHISEKRIIQYGPAHFMMRVLEEIEREAWDKVSVTGVRTPADVAALKEHFGNDFLLVYVDGGDVEMRFERARARGSALDPKTLADFLEKDENLVQEFHIEETAAIADMTLKNHGRLEDYCDQIETHIAPHLE